MESNRLGSVQYVKLVPSLDRVDEILGCICLRWAGVNSKENELDRETAVNESDRKVADEWSEAISFEIFRVLCTKLWGVLL